jgi:hypothetical protein
VTRFFFFLASGAKWKWGRAERDLGPTESIPPEGWSLPVRVVGGDCGCGVDDGVEGTPWEIWDRQSRVPPEGWALPVRFVERGDCGWGAGAGD